MKYKLAVVSLLTLCISSGIAYGQSLEKAKLLYSNKLYEDAKRELVAVAVGSGSDEEKAEALNLLGTIAIEEDNYDTAIKNWSEVTRRFPGTAAAKEAATKLPLAEKLAASRKPVPLNEESTSEKVLPGTVLVAGSAPEAPEYADQAVLELMNFLSSKGIRAKNAFPGRTVDATLPNLLERAKPGRGGSVGVVRLHSLPWHGEHAS